MPTIFDNINQKLLPRLQETLDHAYRADFCVGYFNLRGWRNIDDKINQWSGGKDAQCRLLIGMQRRPQDELEAAFSFNANQERMDNKKAAQLKKELAAEFRRQLTVGAPTNADEAGLRRLAQQLKEGKLTVKLFLRHPLHAKLYLLYRDDFATPIIGYMGSSNLTFSGLQGQGELNIDVLDQDPAQKLQQWFEDRWADNFAIDISQELIEIIEESWAGEKPTPPYHIYLKMAYHLSREARAGLSEFSIPREFGDQLFDFQTAAVKIAARHLNQRGGVLIGDVVGLGKTIMATALAKIFEEDFFMETLIICPKNLVKMWEWYAAEYRLRAKVLSITRVQQELPTLRRYRLVLIDESHNLRNRKKGKRYKAIQEYIQRNESRVILLSATPYNKTYQDLSSQLRLFLPEDADLGIRPEQYIREIGEVEFNARHQANMRTLAAFEHSPYAEDWRELMGLFMVRRTRSFIRDNYALEDENGRKYLLMADGTKNYFPTRTPRRVEFTLNEDDPNDQYARLYADDVVDIINNLNLPRYGLGNYVVKNPKQPPNQREKQQLENLSRGGRRLMGFSRTNLFKRLESSGHAFLLSVERHILRNHIFIHALENDLDLPIGTQGAEMLDTRFEDDDAEAIEYDPSDLYDEDGGENDNDESVNSASVHLRTESDFTAQAEKVYNLYATQFRRRFKWIRSDLFRKRKLLKELREDAENLRQILQLIGDWNASQDAQLDALVKLLNETHPDEKVLIFSQFADTVRYLERELQARGVTRVAGVTGGTPDPTALAWRFSPESNGKRDGISPDDELRVLIATDVLSEGQNLQDAHIVVNFDLPWAIIRLIQRVGRVDRIGQQAAEILAYAFWPAEGVERIIRLRERLRQRLTQNAEVVGTDEQFFEDEDSREPLENLYHEKAGILDDEQDTEIDLVSFAYQIWKNATDANPDLKNIIPKLSNVVYSAKHHTPGLETGPEGVLVYMHTDLGASALAWMDKDGNPVSQSQFAILRAAACALDEPAQPRLDNHHDLVQQAVKHMMETTSKQIGGQLGRPSGARYKVYNRLDTFVKQQAKTLLAKTPEHSTLEKAVEQIYRFPLRESAKERLNRQLRANVRDDQLAELVINLYEEDKLCLVTEEAAAQEPRIICSLGLLAGEPANRASE
ncbi:MAG: NgoFVII family restriction endonuclease [Bacteroidetes bacterium]|nr:MAG: NgoFVII family restriction endonuclease [Bacteroidota bacterium]